MAIKDFLYRCRPAQLYIVLVLSICYFIIQMILSHITHALTLLMASYHMLCNIFALSGSIVTIKHSKKADLKDRSRCLPSSTYTTDPVGDTKTFTCISFEEESFRNIECRERKLKNTFGWTRIDVLTMLIVCIILTSLSFSLLVEALQTLVHIDHQDSMHLPIPVLSLGFVGLILNGICYLLIGGYTLHQCNFLHMTPNGDVVLDSATSEAGIKSGDTEQPVVNNISNQHKKQSLVEIFRDISSTLFVIVCAFIVYMSNDEHTAKFIDPILSIFSCVVLATLSYPYMKESCLILLQTIPDSIDMDIFEKTLVSRFPEIVSYHDLHIWQLTGNKYVSTIHIKFKSPKLYTTTIQDVKSFFFDQGITIVTIQPEFQDKNSQASLECLVQCNANECMEKVCCQQSTKDLQKEGTELKTIEVSELTRMQELSASSFVDSKNTVKRSKSVNDLVSSIVPDELNATSKIYL